MTGNLCRGLIPVPVGDMLAAVLFFALVVSPLSLLRAKQREHFLMPSAKPRRRFSLDTIFGLKYQFPLSLRLVFGPACLLFACYIFSDETGMMWERQPGRMIVAGHGSPHGVLVTATARSYC